MKRQQPEAAIQRAVCEQLRLRGRPGLVWFAVPNGGKRNAREAANLKRQGVIPGVADIILLHNSKFFALELKSANGRPTEHQYWFQKAVNEAGGYTCIAQGLDEALRTLTAWNLVR